MSSVIEKQTYSLEQALDIAQKLRDGAPGGGVAFHSEAVIFALFDEIERQTRKGQTDDGDLLVAFGDMRGFNMSSLKKLMVGGIDDNHEGMVEEHLKCFNYAVTQGVHPGQALLAGIQAIGCLLGYAMRSGMHPDVGSAFTALIIKTTQDAAKNVQIITTN